MPIPFYICEKCHREFDRWEDAEKCEVEHLIPIAVEIKNYSIKPYPYSLDVTFNNKERRIYNAADLGG